MPETLARFDKFSLREREILRLMAEGQSATEIAESIGISETVKTHREKLYKKLGQKKKQMFGKSQTTGIT